MYSLSFQHLLLKLVGDKEEVEIAKKVQKALLKTSSATFFAGHFSSIPETLLLLWKTRTPVEKFLVPRGPRS